MNEVIKNTQTFLETLQISASQEVKDWNLDALERAFGWAMYCQEVHRKLRDRPNAVLQLNKSLQIIRSLPSAALSQSEFSFDNLSQSQRRLLKSLLQNPHLSSGLYHRVLTEYSKLDTRDGEFPDWDTLLKDATQCAQAKAARTTLLEMLQVLDNTLDQKDMQQVNSVDQITMEIDATVLRQYICHHLTNSPTPDVTKQHLEENLHRICSQKEHGLSIVGSILTLPSSDDIKKTEAYKRCDEFVFKWIMTHKDRYVSTAEKHMEVEQLQLWVEGVISSCLQQRIRLPDLVE